MKPLRADRHRRPHRRRETARRRAVLAAAILCVGLLATAGAVWVAESMAATDRAREAESRARNLAAVLLPRLHSIELGLGLIAEDLRQSHDEASLQVLTTALRSRHPELRWVARATTVSAAETAALHDTQQTGPERESPRPRVMESIGGIAVVEILPPAHASTGLQQQLVDDHAVLTAVRRVVAGEPMAVSSRTSLSRCDQFVAVLRAGEQRPDWCRCSPSESHGPSFLLAGVDERALAGLWHHALSESNDPRSVGAPRLETSFAVARGPHAGDPTRILFGDSVLTRKTVHPTGRALALTSVWAMLIGLLVSMGLTHMMIGWVDRETVISRLVARRTAELDSVQRSLQDHAENVEREVSARTSDLRAVRGELLQQTEELIATNRTLEDRNREIESFYHVVSHELRTPLTAIQEFLTILRDGLAGEVNEEQGECLDASMESCVQMRRCVDDLFDISRLETGKLLIRPTQGDLLLVLTRASRAAALTAQREGIKLDTIFPPTIPDMRIDADRITQVIGNVLGNAVKFTPRGGHVLLEVAYLEADRNVEIVITDDGPGIPTHQLERIFDRLHQIRSDETQTHGGLGLGLTLCRLIVEFHGGSIYAESGEGRGTTIRIHLPIDAPKHRARPRVVSSGKLQRSLA